MSANADTQFNLIWLLIDGVGIVPTHCLLVCPLLIECTKIMAGKIVQTNKSNSRLICSSIFQSKFEKTYKSRNPTSMVGRMANIIANKTEVTSVKLVFFKWEKLIDILT